MKERISALIEQVEKEKKEMKNMKRMFADINHNAAEVAEKWTKNASQEEDLKMAKLLRQLWQVSQCCLNTKETFCFWSEFVPKLAESYPITIRTMWAEAHLFNLKLRRTSARGQIEDIYFKLLK